MSSTESIATPGLADVAGDAGMVAVVAAVGRQVEGDADALGAAGQRLAVEVVRRLGGGKAGVLADRPGPHRVHRRLRAADVGRKAGQRVGGRQALQVGRGVERLDDDAFGRLPGDGVEVAARRRACCRGAPRLQGRGFIVEGAGHWSIAAENGGPIIGASAATIPDHEKADSEPRRRRRPGRRHRPSRRAAGEDSRRPAPLQAPDARLAGGDGAQDLGGDRPAPAGAAEHRHHPRPGLARRGRHARRIARRRPRSRGGERAGVRHRRRRDLRPRPAPGRRARADRDRRRISRRHLLSGVGPGRFQADFARGASDAGRPALQLRQLSKNRIGE